jgi:hypothetical protein
VIKTKRITTPIRKLHMNNVQKINDLYIEISDFAFLASSLTRSNSSSSPSMGRFKMSVPSMKGKDITISRKYDDIINVIKARIE